MATASTWRAPRAMSEQRGDFMLLPPLEPTFGAVPQSTRAPSSFLVTRRPIAVGEREMAHAVDRSVAGLVAARGRRSARRGPIALGGPELEHLRDPESPVEEPEAAVEFEPAPLPPRTPRRVSPSSAPRPASPPRGSMPTAAQVRRAVNAPRPQVEPVDHADDPVNLPAIDAAPLPRVNGAEPAPPRSTVLRRRGGGALALPSPAEVPSMPGGTDAHAGAAIPGEAISVAPADPGPSIDAYPAVAPSAQPLSADPAPVTAGEAPAATRSADGEPSEAAVRELLASRSIALGSLAGRTPETRIDSEAPREPLEHATRADGPPEATQPPTTAVPSGDSGIQRRARGAAPEPTTAPSTLSPATAMPAPQPPAPSRRAMPGLVRPGEAASDGESIDPGPGTQRRDRSTASESPLLPVEAADAMTQPAPPTGASPATAEARRPIVGSSARTGTGSGTAGARAAGRDAAPRVDGAPTVELAHAEAVTAQDVPTAGAPNAMPSAPVATPREDVTARAGAPVVTGRGEAPVVTAREGAPDVTAREGAPDVTGRGEARPTVGRTGIQRRARSTRRPGRSATAAAGGASTGATRAQVVERPPGLAGVTMPSAQPQSGPRRIAVPESVREVLRSSVGEPPTHVTVHEGPVARAEADAIDAEAFTRDGQVHLADATVDSPRGQQLLAHELTHVMQQQASPGRMPAEHTHEGRGMESAALEVERLMSAPRSAPVRPSPLRHATADAPSAAAPAASAPLVHRAEAVASPSSSSSTPMPSPVPSSMPSSMPSSLPASASSAAPTGDSGVQRRQRDQASDALLGGIGDRAGSAVAGVGRSLLSGLETELSPPPSKAKTTSKAGQLERQANALYPLIRARLRADLVRDLERRGRITREWW